MTVYPFYHFETPDNAPAGFQDLVYEGPDGNKYAARKDDGSVVLLDASTNGDNVDGYETTVFTIECDGRMAMGTPSTHYVWALDGDFTKATVGTGHSKIILLPRAASIEVNPKQIRTTVTNDAKARRSRNKMNTKRSDYNEGQSPRCPNNPPELVAKTLTKAQGGRDAQANGCGSAGIGGYLVPDYKFTPCCDAHDLCYDNCENGRKENCDHNFGSCMHSVCDKIPWWQPLDQYACPRIANFYEWFVETWGNSAYSSANKERCGCFCPHRYDNSLPADDSFNCGGCGNQCPDKTHCKSSKCVCNQDTCDNKCVDVKSHPKNCGSCGNVCSSGICKDGACYTPKSVAITNKCPADKVFLKMGRVMYYSKYGYGNTMGDVRDLRGDSDALYYGDPERYSLNNHGLGFTKGQCCDTCYSMDDCLLFYMQKQYDEVYCWTVNQERRDTLFTALAFSPEKKQCHFGGFELEPMNVGDGSVDNGYSDSEVEFGPCVNGNNPTGDWSEHLYGS
ncbi:hypothetical protein BU16DRAFT_529931 [Lophium mytilinum]|uniref:Uncharacterized protein n=1 Tax=Lophium mytilinum TaxID=390894 RepID=A0A6A6QG62_9PEZI|nr:hypothetical protein BU16DRAFT_529931 [Lophium mytilinum]